MFILLSAASLMFGQISKTSFTNAPVVGFLLGFAFSIFATFTALKAYAVRKNNIQRGWSVMPIATGYYLGFVFLVIGLLFLGTLLLQYLWNTTIPELFNLKPVSYWQAFRLLLIASILFGGPYIN